MATEVVVSFAVERIGDMLIQEVTSLKSVREQVERLQEDLRGMNCFLKEAEKKQEEDERVRKWVSEIREAVYDAEDIIDMFILKAEALRTNCFLKRLFKKLMNLYEVGKKIKAIQLRLQDISNRREALGIRNIGEGTSRSAQMLQDLRRSSPHAEEHVIVGLKKEAGKLVEQLISGDQRRRVISIVGMGGIGKTTLAKVVYNHEEIVKHFPDYRAWVYVSQDCRPREVYMQIINQVCAPTEKPVEMEKLQEYQLGDFLHGHLKKKRYLIVLDDVWTRPDWDCLAKMSSNDADCPGNVFPDSRNGSRLLLTTRDMKVAQHADARGIPHEMQLLSKQESWDLFRKKAFLDAGTESYPPDLKELGEGMVEKCNGLPLAIVVLGGLLSRNMSYTEWKKVHDNISAYLAKEDQMGVMALLNLSYINLPHYLKPCFLHLSLFPEDYAISTRKLLLLWLAEGFVVEQDRQGKKDMAEVYLNELINRNLIQVVKISVNARVMECRIHDLVRELAIKKAKEENFIGTNTANPLSPSTSSSLTSYKSRRQSIYSDFERYASIEHSTPYLRSLLFFNLGHGTGRVSQLVFIGKCFKVLRVLDLEGIEIESLPDIVGKLIHLRYLGLRCTGLKMLPSSMGNLMSLQTLDVKIVKQVANVIWKMKNLQYLYIEGQEDDAPLQVDTLQNLQILSGIRFNQWSQNDSSKLTCLEKLKLEGRCEIDGVEFSNSIGRLDSLKSLYLKAWEESIIPALTMNSWLHLSKLEMKGRIQKLPEALQFPPSLTQLTLDASLLEFDPMPVLEKLPKLLILRLRAKSYLGNEMQVSANGFPRLKVLQLSGLKELTKLNIGQGSMSRLMQLEIQSKLNISGFKGLLNLVELNIMPISFTLAFSIRRAISGQRLLPWDFKRTTNNEIWIYREKGLTSETSRQAVENLANILETSRESSREAEDQFYALVRINDIRIKAWAWAPWAREASLLLSSHEV